MPIKVEWLDETRYVILWTIEDPWTLDDLHNAYTFGNNLCLEEPTHTINALIDMTHSSAIPNNIFSALSARKRTNTPNYDMAVLVSKNGLVKAFVNTLNHLPGLREQFIVMTTREAALGFIEKRRAQRSAKLNMSI